MEACTCDKWAVNIKAMNAIVVHAHIHGIRSEHEDKFEYCPWCGKELMKTGA